MFLYEPPERPKKIKTMPGRSPERRLEAAIKHIMKRWLPVNGRLLQTIRDKLHRGEYISERESLIEAIKQDPALFLYCSRNASHLAESTGLGVNPLTILRELDAKRLMEFFNVQAGDISKHELQSMSQQQALSLQYSLFSSMAAEAIARGTDIEPGIAFTTAYFRQLGLNLIAWNYPKIYSEALSMHRKRKSDVEHELSEYLGVSPLQIAARFAADWSITPEVRGALNESPVKNRDGSKRLLDLSAMRNNGISIIELCQVAELYGQLKDPVNFPLAELEWSKNIEFINERFKVDELHAVEEKVREAIGLFAESSRAVLSLPIAERYRQAFKQQRSTLDASHSNAYVHKCPQHIRERFNEAYSLLQQNRVSIEAINKLLASVVPVLGFHRGCLFLLQKPQMELTPVLRIGEYPLEAYHGLLQTGDLGANFALHSIAPIKRDGIGVDHRPGVQICGALGDLEHPGILYLELSPESIADVQHDTLLYFHALRQALIHCFGMRPAGVMR